VSEATHTDDDCQLAAKDAANAVIGDQPSGPLKVGGAVPQTAPIPPAVPALSISGPLNFTAHSPEGNQRDRRYRSARLELTGPKILFQYRSAGRRAVITSSGRCWLRSGPRPQSCGQLAGLYFYTSPPTSRTYYSAADRLVFGSPVTVSCHINMTCHLGTWRSLHPTPRRLTATVLT